MVDLGNITSGLYRVLGGIKQFMPLAKAVGGPLLEKALNIITATLETAENVKEAISDGKVIAKGSDLEEIKDIIAELQKENDELNQYIINN